MNENHIQQIFDNYIDQFERINDHVGREYYKWQIAKRFREEMDKALDAPLDKFPEKLYEVKKLTENVIDSYTTPFHGLVKFAEQEPKTVRGMFLELFAALPDDIADKQKRVDAFLAKSHELREKYYPDSFLYKDDMHSVTGYLFLYDPDHNYLFKASHALKFADCIEYYNDWGSGDSVKLDVYYRMCDQLVERIKNCKELMATDASRFEEGWGVDPDTLYSDPEKHILAFDIIYCCSSYGLFNGISFSRPKSKERSLMNERKEKAIQLSNKMKEAKEDLQKLEEAKEFINDSFSAGKHVIHKKYGEGIIKENAGEIIVVDFSGEIKELDAGVCIVNGIISIDDAELTARLEEYSEVLENADLIKSRLTCAEREFAYYSEYLE